MKNQKYKKERKNEIKENKHKLFEFKNNSSFIFYVEIIPRPESILLLLLLLFDCGCSLNLRVEQTISTQNRCRIQNSLLKSFENHDKVFQNVVRQHFAYTGCSILTENKPKKSFKNRQKCCLYIR